MGTEVILHVEKIEMTGTPRLNLPPFDQVGIVVRNIDRAIEFYGTAFGIGPFHIMEIAMKGFIFRDLPGDCRLKIAITQSGPIEIELIQVLEGETPHTEFLKERGEGIQHLRFRVRDLGSVLAELAKEGVKPVFRHSLPNVNFAYVHSDSMGSVQFELIEFKKSPAG